MMPWRYTVKVSDVWKSDMSFEAQRDEIVKRLKRHVWYTESGELREVVSGLSNSDDAARFDRWWNILYDLADEDRVWVETH